MANITVDALPALATPSGSSLLVVQESSVEYKSTIDQVIDNSGSAARIANVLQNYTDLTALQTAVPTGSDGDFAVLETEGTIAVWDGAAWSVASAALHATTHQPGGADPIKLDDLATPDDNTDLDATSSKHGLMPKADKAKLDSLTGIGSGQVIIDDERRKIYFAMSWTFSSATTATDPGSGGFKLNNATQSSASAMYISDITDIIARDVSALFDNVATDGVIFIWQVSDATRWLSFTIDGSLSDAGWFTVPVVYSDGGSAIQDGAECVIEIHTGVDPTDIAQIGTNVTNIATNASEISQLLDLTTLTASATITFDCSAELTREVTLTGAHTLAFSNVVKGMRPLLFVNQNATGTGTLALDSAIMVAATAQAADGGAPAASTIANATDVYEFAVDNGGTVHLMSHSTRSHRATAITLDEIVEMPNTIGFSHDFGGSTNEVPLWCNGERVHTLRYNPNDSLHYGTVWLPSETDCKFEMFDTAGAWRTFSARTIEARRTKSFPLRIRYVSPDVAEGGGSYTYADPGNLKTACAAAQIGDEIRLFAGTQAYWFTDRPSILNADTNVNIVAVDGQKPVISGVPPNRTHSWTVDSGNRYTLDPLTGTHDGSSGASVLTDSGEAWPVGELVGLIISNTTDGSSGEITANTATTITATLTGGTDNDWDSGDAYSIQPYDDDINQIVWDEEGKLERIADFATAAECSSSGRGGWANVSGTLYLELPDGSNPNNATLHLPQTSTKLMEIYADDAWVEGITFEHVGASTSTRGLLLQTSARTTIRECTFKFISLQGVYAPSCDDLIVEDCEFIEGHEWLAHDDWKSDGALDEVSTCCYLSGCERVVLRNNLVFELGDWNNLKATSGSNRYVDIHDNRFVRGVDSGELNGTHTQIRYWNNTWVGTHTPMIMSTTNGGPIWWINNSGKDCGYVSPADILQGPPASNFYNQIIKHSSPSPGPSTIAQLFLYNNTFNSEYGTTDYHIGALGIRITAGYPHGDTVARNNIFTGTGQLFTEESNPTSVHDWDYDQWYSSNIWGYGFLYTFNGTTHASFSLFKSASGLETNGVEANPNLDQFNLPAAELPGTVIPGITGNRIFGSLRAAKGSNRRVV